MAIAKIGVVQFWPKLFEVEKNLRKALNLVKDFDGDFLVFPELSFTGYLFNSEKEIERVSRFNRMVERRWMEFSRDKKCTVIFGFPEKEKVNFFNSSMMIFPDGKKRVYRKTHLFSEEKKFFKPGDTGFFVEEFRGVKVGLAICFDWFFPESFRTLSLMGADLIAHSANLVMPYCQDSNVYASLQNRVYIATANRWGKDANQGKELIFTGKSQITAPNGITLKKASERGDTLLEVEINTAFSKDKRINKFNDVFEDRKPKFYVNLFYKGKNGENGR